MNTLYKQYIEMYGNFSHILNIIIDFTFLDFFNSVKIGVLNVQRCK